MIIFYKQVQKVTPIRTLVSDSCDIGCASNCIKPKSKCCNKYKKKGINCKRCPLNNVFKAVS